MKLKNIILSCMLLAGLTATAQEQEAKTEYDFKPHWNIFIQPLGAQYTLGEVDFNDLVSYNFQLGAGYQFNPIIGARLSVNAYQSKAGWRIFRQKYNEVWEAQWKWNYIAPMADVTVNLCNLFGGYNPERLFNLGIFAGIGVNIAWNNDEAADAAYINDLGNGRVYNQNVSHLWSGTKARFAARAGVTGDFRITDNWSVGLEIQANTLSDKYNSKDASNSDWYFNGLIGVKYNFGKTHTKRTVAPAAPAVQERIIEKIIEKVVEVPTQAKVAESDAVVEEVEALRRDIFFTINSTTITAQEQVKVDEIVAYMKKYPASSITITGYADKGTGNASINKRLSKNRANTVAEALKKHGISPSRIKTDSKGDTVQPYEKPILNRVSICIAE